MKDRIIEFIELEKLTAAEFADHIGVQRSSVSHVLNGRNNPSFAFIQKIIEHYPHLNPRWLMTGEGSIYDDEKKTLDIGVSPQQKLFSTVENEPDQTVKTDLQNKQSENSSPGNELPKPFTHDVSELDNNPKRIVKVLIFYDDHTFEDFHPAK